MKKLGAIFAGILLAVICVLCFDKHMDTQIMENKEVVRNHRSYERFGSSEVQKLVMDENTLPIFGSSELMPIIDYNEEISSFLNGNTMNVMTIGAGYFQSLSHTMELGAIEEEISSRKVALFLSPQWFGESGISTEAFPTRFGEDNLLSFLENDKISKGNKEYVLNRTLDLLVESPTQYERVRKYKQGFENPLGFSSIYTKIMGDFWKVRQEYQVYCQIDEMEKKVPEIELDKLNFEQMLALAEEQGGKACTNNEFGIYDDYWNRYVKGVYEQGEVEEKNQVYTESVEYEDLRCFLNVAEELEIEVLLVHIPVHEKWCEYVGQKADIYYENIRNIVKEYKNIKLIDMTEYAGEKYFFKDVMHLGWKGWTRINEALYKEFKDQRMD